MAQIDAENGGLGDAPLTLPLGLGSLIMGGLYSTTVVAGIHHMYTVIDMGQLSMYGVPHTGQTTHSGSEAHPVLPQSRRFAGPGGSSAFR